MVRSSEAWGGLAMGDAVTRRLVRWSVAVGLLVGTLGLVDVPSVAEATHGTLIRVGSTSTNWSGYVAKGGPFTSVTSSWTESSAVCGSKATYSAFWVGLDGDGSTTVEQTGSELDCSRGLPVYAVWYELYPKAPVYFTEPVSAGDAFQASVVASAGGHFALTLTDHTSGWSRVVHATDPSAKRASAEVIAEAPSSSRVLPLTDFGSVTFTAAGVDGTTLGGAGATPITMASGATVKAKPGRLVGGAGFTDVWHHT